MPEAPYRDSLLALPDRDDELARRALEGAIEPGERLVWVGRPTQGLRLTALDLYAIPFSLIWGGFAIFWEVGVIVSKAPLLMCLWGVPFVAVGLYIMVGRFFVDARRRARTFYGLTRRRALILVDGSTRRLTALDLAGQHQIEVEEGRRGRGTVRFGHLGRRTTPPAFEEIREASAVYACIRESQRSLVERAGGRPEDLAEPG